jgi:hypothetical protein
LTTLRFRLLPLTTDERGIGSQSWLTGSGVSNVKEWLSAGEGLNSKRMH